MEDHCPKCGNKVASPVPVDEPAPPVEVAPPVVVEPELPTSAPLLEPRMVETPQVPLVQEPPVVADLPLESVHDEPPLVEQEPEPEPELFEAELPANVEATLPDEEESEHEEPPAPEQQSVPEKLPVPEHGPRPPLPAHVGEKGTSLLESILRPSHQPLTAALRPSVTEVTPKPLPGAHSPAPFPLRPIADDPQRLEIEDPGMGEILEDHFTHTGVSGITRHRAPGLGIDLMQVEDSDQSERRNRRGRIALRGVIVFIIVDLCLVGWFGWARVKKWWTYEPQVIHKAVPVPDPPSEARNEGPTGAEADKEQKPMPGTAPAAPLPKPEPPAIPPVSDLLPSASPKATFLTLPQIQPGS